MSNLPTHVLHQQALGTEPDPKPSHRGKLPCLYHGLCGCCAQNIPAQNRISHCEPAALACSPCQVLGRKPEPPYDHAWLTKSSL